MSDWLLNGEAVSHDFIPSEYIGFIYVISYTDGTKYIGKKNFWTTKEMDSLKSGKKRDGHIEYVGRNRGGKRVYRERVKTEMNWRRYNGSSAYTDGKEIQSKEILMMCKEKIDLTYWETYYLMERNVLFDDKYLNQNILGKFYSGQLAGSKEHTKD